MIQKRLAHECSRGLQREQALRRTISNALSIFLVQTKNALPDVDVRHEKWPRWLEMIG